MLITFGKSGSLGTNAFLKVGRGRKARRVQLRQPRRPVSVGMIGRRLQAALRHHPPPEKARARCQAIASCRHHGHRRFSPRAQRYTRVSSVRTLDVLLRAARPTARWAAPEMAGALT